VISGETGVKGVIGGNRYNRKIASKEMADKKP